MSFDGQSNIAYHPVPNLVISQNPSLGGQSEYFGPEPIVFVETPMEKQHEPVYFAPMENISLEPQLETEENEIRACGLRSLHRAVIMGMLLALLAIAIQAYICFKYIPSLPQPILDALPTWFFMYLYTAIGVHLCPFLGAICVLTGECVGRVGSTRCCQQQQGAATPQPCRQKSQCTIIVFAITAGALIVFRVADFIFAAVMAPNIMQLVGAVLYILAWVRIMFLIYHAAKLRDNSNKVCAMQDAEIEMAMH